MKFRKKMIAAAFVASAIALSVSAQGDNQGINNPMTRAVLGAYDKMLKEDPRDYETYLNRANEYYRHGEYMRALSDVDKALECMPEADALRFPALMLRGLIYQQTNKHEQALNDFASAWALDATSYPALYQKANSEYELGRYAEAKSDYLRLQRLGNGRSLEALVGLARVAVKESNLGLANDYLDQAVQLDNNNPEVYLRRASVRKSMGNVGAAVEDVIVALSIESDNPRAVEAIVDYANSDYPAVMTSLSNAIAQAPKVPLYRYLRAVIAQAHYHYKAALADFEVIINENLYKYHGINASIAECLYSLGQFERALDEIDTALSAVNDNASYFVIRSRVLRAMGRYDEATDAAVKATVVGHNGSEPLAQLGLCYMSKGDYEQASSLFGEATLTDNESPYLYMLRAWVLERNLNQPVAARGFYEHVASMDNITEYNVKSLRGFAYLFGGDRDKAAAWMEKALSENSDHDGLASYYAACLYTQMGDNDKALEYVKKALENGYGSYYDWMCNTDARINCAALRDDLRFLNLIERNKQIF